MPFVTRKRIRLLRGTPPVSFEIDLSDKKLPQHYMLDTGLKPTFYGDVKFIVDDKNNLISAPNRPCKFDFDNPQSGYANYHRYLILPRELTNDFAIQEGWGLEVILNKVVIGGEVKGIFSSSLVEDASMDFEISYLGKKLPINDLLILVQFENRFYEELVAEINDTFRMAKFTSCMVLLRKLFENLLIEMFRERYGTAPPGSNTYFNPNRHTYRSFDALINHLEANITDFEPCDPQISKDKDFMRFLKMIKRTGDDSAHTLEILHSGDKITALKEEANRYCEMTVRIIQRIKASKNP
jgi:hypothetical protein